MIWIAICVMLTAAAIATFLFAGRSTKRQVPVIYSIGWWVHQNKLKLIELEVKVVKSDLNLLCSSSVVAYTVRGTLLQEDNYKMMIGRVHLSERVIKTGTFEGSEAEIKITPIVVKKKDKSAKAGIIEFEFCNHHIVKSMSWGTNRVTFICGDQARTIELLQRK